MFADTIVALSSGRLPSGVAIVRISGSQTRFAIETICGEIPVARRAAYVLMRDASGHKLDRGLALFFPGPASFTGEDCGELHIHGSKAVAAALLGALASLPNVRLAEPGEFTRRAFLNGKVDLLQAEALADLVSAETEAQRRLALRNSEGSQSGLYLEWRRRLVHARAMIEAELDFADESDVPGSVSDAVWSDIAMLHDEIGRHIAGYRAAEIIREGFDVVILGAPNVGKSSLLNALAKRDVALVSDEAGTTRDLVEVVLEIDGAKVRFTDTAGIRENAGKVEAMGIARAQARAESADMVVRLMDASLPSRDQERLGLGRSITVVSKADQLRLNPLDDGIHCDFLVSSLTGMGIDALVQHIGQAAKEATEVQGDVFPSRLRHVVLLRETEAHLEIALAKSGLALELRAEELRLAGNRLGRITGALDVEDLLDVIFSQFCIGK